MISTQACERVSLQWLFARLQGLTVHMEVLSSLCCFGRSRDKTVYRREASLSYSYETARATTFVTMLWSLGVLHVRKNLDGTGYVRTGHYR